MKNYLNKTKETGHPNLYHVVSEFDDRYFVVALQGGKDFEERLTHLVQEYYEQDIVPDSLKVLEGSKYYENKFEAETEEGSMIYIEGIEIW